MSKPTTAVAVAEPATISAAEMTSLLQQHGYAEQQADRTARIKFTNGMLIAQDTGAMFVYNPKTDAPMATVRLLGLPDEYFVIWIDKDMAAAIGQPDLEGKPSKKYLHSDPNRRTWDSDAAYDHLAGLGYKGNWSGDLQVQIIPDTGTMTGDETVYLLTLPTTSLIEFKGASRNPEKGAVSDLNFIHKLGIFAVEQLLEANPDATKAEQQKAALDAMTSLRLGGVAAEIRAYRQENKERGQSWMVLSFTPVHVETPDTLGAPALPPGDVGF